MKNLLIIIVNNNDDDNIVVVARMVGWMDDGWKNAANI